MNTFLSNEGNSNQVPFNQIQSIQNKLNQHQPLNDSEFFTWFHHTICQKNTRQEQAYRNPGQ